MSFRTYSICTEPVFVLIVYFIESLFYIHDCFLQPTVLSIQKHPKTMTSDVTFPMKGWRGMMEWVRNLDEKIVVSRNALSLDVPGIYTHSVFSVNS